MQGLLPLGNLLPITQLWVYPERRSAALGDEDGVEGSGESVPFEFVGQVASASSVAKTGHVESSTAARGHDGS